MSESLLIKTLPHFIGLKLPTYQSESASGMDLPAALIEAKALFPGDRALIPTGISIELPMGYEAQIRPRSGLAVRDGLTVLNTPGTIDADYRGEIMVLLVNLGQAPFLIERGMRIAQMVIAKTERLAVEITEELSQTDRGAGGFGSSGMG